MRNALPFALVLALAACGSPPAEQTAPVTNDTVANETEVVAETPVAQPNQPADDAAPLPSAVPTLEPVATPTSDSPSDTATIPAALRGRWGLAAEDCTSTRGDAKGLLRIAADTIRFYESRGILRRVIERDDSRIVADFDFEGEGQTWKRRMTLDGQNGGKTLVRRDQGADAMPGPLRYARCAG